ncbi:PVL ORF-50-like family protein [Staphylococcus aureus]|nr:PVL ORF-50-like family protein [Staphylococcus aureus]
MKKRERKIRKKRFEPIPTNVRAEYEEERKRRLRPWLYDGTPQNILVIRTGLMSLISKCSRNGVKHNEHNQ